MVPCYTDAETSGHTSLATENHAINESHTNKQTNKHNNQTNNAVEGAIQAEKPLYRSKCTQASMLKHKYIRMHTCDTVFNTLHCTAPLG